MNIVYPDWYEAGAVGLLTKVDRYEGDIGVHLLAV